MYVNSTCISDGQLEDVLGALIGNTQNTPSSEEGLHGDNESELSMSGSHSNATTTVPNPTLIPDECQGTCHGYITTCT